MNVKKEFRKHLMKLIEEFVLLLENKSLIREIACTPRQGKHPGLVDQTRIITFNCI